MAAFADVCRFRATSTGTVDFVDASALAGYQRSSTACVDGKLYSLRAESDNLTQWEIVQGVYTASSGTFARTTVLFNSSGTTSKINFTAAPQVAVVGLAEDFREKLVAGRNYYIRSDGSDSNTGLANSAGGAFLTKQKAYDVIAGTLDLGGYTVTIQIVDGTYTDVLSITQPWTGGGAITYQGNSGTPANVLNNVAAGTGFSTSVPIPGVLTIKDMKIAGTNSSSGIGILMQAGGVIQFGNIDFGTLNIAIQTIGFSANVQAVSNYKISGSQNFHFLASGGNVTIDNRTVTLTGTPAWGVAVAYSTAQASISAQGVTFTGAATGQRFIVQYLAFINSNGGGANYFPGNVAGSGTNPGASPYGLYN